MPPVDLIRMMLTYVVARLGIEPDNEDGLTTTEIAVVTFLLVGAAIVVMGIIYNAAKNNANNIPEPTAPAASGTP